MTTQIKICSGFFGWLHSLKSLFFRSGVKQLDEDYNFDDPYIEKLVESVEDPKKND